MVPNENIFLVTVCILVSSGAGGSSTALSHRHEAGGRGKQEAGGRSRQEAGRQEAGRQEAGGRGVASAIISHRQEDEQAGIATEKYSGLRIKYVSSTHHLIIGSILSIDSLFECTL